MESDQTKVLVNNEGQYSIWPAWKEVPEGWKETPFVGSKEEALSYVRTVWVDMTPNSLKSR